MIDSVAEEDLEDFAPEIHVMKECSSPYIVKFFGAYQKGDEIFVLFFVDLESPSFRLQWNSVMVGPLTTSSIVSRTFFESIDIP